MKTLYLIRDAKSDWTTPDTRDFERSLTKKGKKDVKTIGSYFLLRGISPDLILSSFSLRSQETSDLLAKVIDSDAKKLYMEEFYMKPVENMKEIIMAQDNSVDKLFVIGHNPQISEIINMINDEHVNKVPSMGVVAVDFEIKEWSELENTKGKIDFFIFPKQFKYYMPKQIRASLPLT
ncbi:MAG: histidine phosphatase [Campylobacterota bacterium]|nr:histidine phosphatase [Campylobacterota bacterium]